jgi:glutamate dehydrogenase
VHLSLEISQEINEVTDALLEEFSGAEEEVLKDPLFQSIIYRHCPRILSEKYRERLLERLPPAHQIAIVSAYIASYIVYREGLGWLHTIPEGQRFKAARMYMSKDELAYQLVEAVEKSGLKQKDKIAEILRRSAARDLTMLEIEEDANNGNGD